MRPASFLNTLPEAGQLLAAIFRAAKSAWDGLGVGVLAGEEFRHIPIR
jgi:hypothetical protein